MRHLIITVLILLGASSAGFSQFRYSGKLEACYLSFNNTTIDVEPGPGWKGYYLDNDQNGIDVNLINGVKFREKLFAGIGIGYQNFEGIRGAAFFSDLGYIPFQRKFSPLLNAKIGYAHIWNQYKGGRGTTLLELGGGVRYKLTARMGIYLQSGIALAHQSSFYPFKIGVSF